MSDFEKGITIHQCVTLNACQGIQSCISRDKCMRQIGAEFEQRIRDKERLMKGKGDE
jgi:hypothetical protein